MLTKRMRETLEFIESELAITGGVAPSLEQICVALGLSNKSAAHRLLGCLEERGYIRRLHHRARAMEVLRPSASAKMGVIVNWPGTRRVAVVDSCIPIPVMGWIN